MFVYMNIECGNVHETFADMWEEGCEMYDLGDPTNLLTWRDYYEIVEVK